MLNDFTRLDSKFVEGLTTGVVDDVFISWVFFREDDYFTARDIVWDFVEYPGLDTIEKVEDKTFECLMKMLKNNLIYCINRNIHNEPISVDEVIAQEDTIDSIVHNHAEDGKEYDYEFDITGKGYEFMKRHLWDYQPIIDEINRLYNQDIDHGLKNQQP